MAANAKPSPMGQMGNRQAAAFKRPLKQLNNLMEQKAFHVRLDKLTKGAGKNVGQSSKNKQRKKQNNAGRKSSNVPKPQMSMRPTNPKSDYLRITPMGGNEEVGRNMTLFEYGGDIIILDMGIQFPEEDMPGIDYIVPNINYLKGKEKISWTAAAPKLVEGLEGKSFDSGVIEGTIACRGKAKGRARLVLTNDIKKIKFNRGGCLGGDKH